MEGFILDSLGFLETLDFAFFTQVLGIVFIIFWLFVVGWVWFDASERYKSVWLRLINVILVLVLNIFGFVVYLIIRPKVTLEEIHWMDLERRFLKFEAAGLEDCSRCGEEVLPNFIHCPNCGKELRTKCVSCDIYLEPDWNVCPFCGVKQNDIDVVQRKNKKKSKGIGLGKKIAVGYDGLIKFVGNLAKHKPKVKTGDKVSKRKETTTEKNVSTQTDEGKKRDASLTDNRDTQEKNANVKADNAKEVKKVDNIEKRGEIVKESSKQDSVRKEPVIKEQVVDNKNPQADNKSEEKREVLQSIAKKEEVVISEKEKTNSEVKSEVKDLADGESKKEGIENESAKNNSSSNNESTEKTSS